MGKGNSAKGGANGVAAGCEAPPEPTREAVHFFASQIGCDPRLARRVLMYGPQVCRNLVQRERAFALVASLATAEAGR
jgi:hypothetical protein